ncbi:MAG: metallophosphoesterase family protein [Acidimicrobiia bacterium]|nr:metallophosphoesterase family protein [Acidimicrobiia bacterium]
MGTVHDAELYSVGTDEIVATFRTEGECSVTTVVGEAEVTTSGTYHSARITGLEPGVTYPLKVDGADPSELLPDRVTTLAPLPGRILAKFATVNDVHFGERVCGRLGTGEQMGPLFESAQGAEPYPVVMNRGAIAELAALDASAILVKGDLTNAGTVEQYEEFLAAYSALGPTMHHVRGNHDAMVTEQIASAHAPFAVGIPGALLAVLDTVRPGTDRGRLSAAQIEWLDTLAAESSDPVLVFGHHHPWNPASDDRPDTYFGINPDDSESLCAVIDRREAIAGYFAGHTHRNRVRRFAAARSVPMVEIACVKDYPGAWAEYHVYDSGYVQIARRISAHDAMAWTEQTRHMFQGMYRDYALGSLDERCFVHSF